MDVLKGIRVFVACAESGSFVAAARRLGISGAAVSRQIAALEVHVGARLFNRSTRSLSLTEAGETLFSRASGVLAELDALTASSSGEAGQAPQGLLRISAPLSFGLRKLGTLIPGFLARYPEVRLDIDLSDRMVDLVHEGFDVALRINPPGGSHNLIMRRISPVRLVLCCTPEFLARSGTPASPADLAHLETLNYSYFASGRTWNFRHGSGKTESVQIAPKVQTTNGDLLRDIAIGYGGMSLQPDFIVNDDLMSGRMVEVLPEWQVTPSHLCAVYASRQFLPAKVRVFIDYLVAQLSNDIPGTDTGRCA